MVIFFAKMSCFGDPQSGNRCGIIDLKLRQQTTDRQTTTFQKQANGSGASRKYENFHYKKKHCPCVGVCGSIGNRVSTGKMKTLF